MKQIVYVLWVDAVSHSGWIDEADVPSVHQVETIGILVKENDEEIVIASTKSGTEVNCIIAIPRAWVKDFHRVRLVKE